jgi:hypothetical protein
MDAATGDAIALAGEIPGDRYRMPVAKYLRGLLECRATLPSGNSFRAVGCRVSGVG